LKGGNKFNQWNTLQFLETGPGHIAGTASEVDSITKIPADLIMALFASVMARSASDSSFGPA
jgi:hypothetical protein